MSNKTVKMPTAQELIAKRAELLGVVQNNKARCLDLQNGWIIGG
jgi:hypothetical protein